MGYQDSQAAMLAEAMVMGNPHNWIWVYPANSEPLDPKTIGCHSPRCNTGIFARLRVAEVTIRHAQEQGPAVNCHYVHILSWPEVQQVLFLINFKTVVSKYVHPQQAVCFFSCVIIKYGNINIIYLISAKSDGVRAIHLTLCQAIGCVEHARTQIMKMVTPQAGEARTR